MAKVYENKHIHQLIDEGYRLDISRYFNQSWALVKANLGIFVGFTVLYCVMAAVMGFIPFIGSLAFAVIAPALQMGYYSVADKLSRGETVTFNNFFDGFSRLGELFLVYLVMGLLVLAGFVLLIIPGIYLAIVYTMALPLTFFQFNGSSRDTLKTSRVIVTKQWWSFLGFYIISFLVILLGVICLGIGIFAALPVVYVAHYFLYKDIIGRETEVKDDPFDHLVNNE